MLQLLLHFGRYAAVVNLLAHGRIFRRGGAMFLTYPEGCSWSFIGSHRTVAQFRRLTLSPFSILGKLLGARSVHDMRLGLALSPNIVDLLARMHGWPLVHHGLVEPLAGTVPLPLRWKAVGPTVVAASP